MPHSYSGVVTLQMVISFSACGIWRKQSYTSMALIRSLEELIPKVSVVQPVLDNIAAIAAICQGSTHSQHLTHSSCPTGLEQGCGEGYFHYTSMFLSYKDNFIAHFLSIAGWKLGGYLSSGIISGEYYSTFSLSFL